MKNIKKEWIRGIRVRNAVVICLERIGQHLLNKHPGHSYRIRPTILSINYKKKTTPALEEQNGSILNNTSSSYSHSRVETLEYYPRIAFYLLNSIIYVSQIINKKIECVI